jgi:hypothetical protein
MARDRGGLPHNFPDRVIREVLQYANNLRALLRAVAPKLADHFNYHQLMVVTPSYLLDDWRERENDLLVRLPFQDEPAGRQVLVCVLVEHQSTVDQAMPLRLLVYAVLFWEQEWKEWTDHHQRGQPLRLTPVLPVVLHTGQELWDTSRRLSDLFDAPEVWQAWLPSWQMPLWDLGEHAVKDLLASQESLWQALAVVRAEQTSTEEFLSVFRTVLNLLEPLAAESKVTWHQLVKMVLYWAHYRRPRREHAVLTEAARTSVREAQLQEEVQTMSELLEKNYEQEVYERGLTKGKAEGMAQGYRESLEEMLRQRFTEVSEAVRQRIASADVNQLKTALSRVNRISSPDDLFS